MDIQEVVKESARRAVENNKALVGALILIRQNLAEIDRMVYGHPGIRVVLKDIESGLTSIGEEITSLHKIVADKPKEPSNGLIFEVGEPEVASGTGWCSCREEADWVLSIKYHSGTVLFRQAFCDGCYNRLYNSIKYDL